MCATCFSSYILRRLCFQEGEEEDLGSEDSDVDQGGLGVSDGLHVAMSGAQLLANFFLPALTYEDLSEASSHDSDASYDSDDSNGEGEEAGGNLGV